MKTIYVKIAEPSFWDNNRVAAVANGFCKHATIDEEEADFDYSSGDPGASHKERILVCRLCFAWRYANDDMRNGWHDEVIIELPEHKTLTKELVLR